MLPQAVAERVYQEAAEKPGEHERAAKREIVGSVAIGDRRYGVQQKVKQPAAQLELPERGNPHLRQIIIAHTNILSAGTAVDANRVGAKNARFSAERCTPDEYSMKT